jgi:hypothetical protein
MRSLKATILLGVGIFLIALAPLLRFYALPHLEKQPLDFYFTDVATGQGTYLDAGSLSIKGPELLTVSRTERGDVKAGNSKVAVWDIFTRVDTASGTLFQAFTERWAFDRKTGASVSGYGETPKHTGNFLVWPFNAPKRTFQYWDQQAKQAFPARYAGEQKLQGHTVYRYVSVIQPTKIGELEVPGSLVGTKDASVQADEYYANDNSVALVDPRTGAVVGGSSHQKVTLRLPGSGTDALTVFEANLVATDKTSKDLLKKASDGAKQLNLIGTTAPLVGLILGLVLIGLAVFFGRRSAGTPRTVFLPSGDRAPEGMPAPRHASYDEPVFRRTHDD